MLFFFLNEYFCRIAIQKLYTYLQIYIKFLLFYGSCNQILPLKNMFFNFLDQPTETLFLIKYKSFIIVTLKILTVGLKSLRKHLGPSLSCRFLGYAGNERNLIGWFRRLET